MRLGDLTEEEARRARRVAGIPEGTLVLADARHPRCCGLLLRGTGRAGGTYRLERLDRDDVFAAHLDLMCLRVAVRLAAANGLRGTAVRRLAARETPARCTKPPDAVWDPGQGQLHRESFEAVFPWGPAPGYRLACITGWAPAVLTEGLLVPAGDGSPLRPRRARRLDRGHPPRPGRRH